MVDGWNFDSILGVEEAEVAACGFPDDPLLRSQWQQLLLLLAAVQHNSMTTGSASFAWKLTVDGSFSVAFVAHAQAAHKTNA